MVVRFLKIWNAEKKYRNAATKIQERKGRKESQRTQGNYKGSNVFFAHFAIQKNLSRSLHDSLCALCGSLRTLRYKKTIKPKSMKFLLLLSVLISGTVFSQETNCEVGIPSLKGKYEGECKSGKASGTGKATGEDSYEGDFKNGLPDGNGKYSWKNGDFYDGAWRKGQREGKGLMAYRKPNGKDSVLNGYWKKDLYKGEYEEPYIIHQNGLTAQNVSFTKQKGDNRKEIRITIETRMAGGEPDITTVRSKRELSNIMIQRGFFLQRVDNNNDHNKNDYYLKQVEFPFRAVISVGMEAMEFEIFEAGSWTIRIEF